jgi:hypothetical protein
VQRALVIKKVTTLTTIKDPAYMEIRTPQCLDIGVLTLPIMIRLLGSFKLSSLIATLHGHPQLAQVVAWETGVCRRSLGRQCFDASLRPMTAGIT